MRRISSAMNNMDTQSALRLQESRLNRANNQIGSQRKIQQLRDDPISAGHLVRYQSYLGRVNTFEKNAATLTDQFSLREGYMTNSLEIMQRVRELAITGANGVYTPEDMKNMAMEVDELLKELVQNANAISSDGNSIFGGTNTKSTAFEVEMGIVAGSGVALIESVRYNGNIDTNRIEVDENKYMDLDNAGNRTFWAEQQQIFGGRDALSWQASADSVISVDGVSVSVNAGDNVHSLAAKINESGAAVRASIDPVTGGLNLETTDARQLWLSDVKGGVLNELGIIKDSSQKPPYNIGNSVRVSGGSLFDTVIAFRDALLKGDVESVGGRVLGSLDNGISNLVTRIAKSGSEYERAQLAVARNSATALNVTQQVSSEGDLDFTKAVTDMKMLDYAYQATLSNAGKMYNNTLLNYMR
ncbi:MULTISPECIES: flagellar hook-associated protein 3 [Treponema]|uniref:flagellar hook-associated protein 3 n=1 Tax=Treponema TaxID=157 RepID=UPI0023570EF1|nr:MULTISPECIES: flagellar hook-associated protein 3 [Treponema]MCI6482682.1 flagellar hook-associated protein 3 [Treponema porcinum]MDD7125466.1 flagellar hook-associated protein 3 [Treponema porcinum]MDY5121397.1 flagellar hook-associated protein 3 [Treponema porcinum]MDY5453763.1 flagellar hook-associated protein 3 [Treponema porcinum]